MDSLRRNPRRAAAVGITAVIVVIVVLLIVALVMYKNNSSGDGGDGGDDALIYDEAEIFQVSLAGTGYGDGTATFNYDSRKQIADDLGAQFGTTYSIPSVGDIQTYGADSQMCQYGWTGTNADGSWASWPYCLGGGSSDSCCNKGTATWSGLSPQPGLFLRGQKPKADQISNCNDSTLAAGTQCIGNWIGGDDSTAAQYSYYD